MIREPGIWTAAAGFEGWRGGAVALAMVLAGCGAADDATDPAPVGDGVVDVQRRSLKHGETQDTPSPQTPVLTWSPCGDEAQAVECAIADVPLDYDQPTGAKTGIALARVRASDPAHRIGTVFVNPGGPGGSGVDLVLNGFGGYLASLLQGRFDVVGFDPRGVASSEPLQCFDTEEEEAAFFTDNPLFPYRPSQERPFFDRMSAFAGQCLGREQRITSHMSTADVVRDLDLLRRAVNDRRLTYLGFSYGTYLGNTYANLYPNNVRAIAIDGVLDPRLWSSGWQISSDAVSTAREFSEFLRLCDEAGEACALAGPGGSAAKYDALARTLRAAPLVFDGFTYGYDYLIADTLGAMYVPEFWGGPEGYAALFAFLAEAALGDAAAGPQARALRRGIEERLRAGSQSRADYDNGHEAFFGTLCADAEFPHSFAEFRAVGFLAAMASSFGPYWWWQNVPCAQWPVSADRYLGPWRASTSAPVLVVGNHFDGVTDFQGAVATSQLLPNSRLLAYAGWGHTAFGRSSCVTEHVVDYLLDGTLPPAGTVCPANPNPFLPAPALRAARAGAAPWVGRPPSWIGPPSGR